MKYRVLGKTGLKVSILGFGGIPLRRISDKEAIDVRHNMSALDDQFGFLDEDDVVSLDVELEVGRYWFLKEGYLKYKYHEILAVHNSCLVVESLTAKGIILSLSNDDQVFYEKILNGQLTCEDFGIKKVYKHRNSSFVPNFLWNSSDWRYMALTKYRKKWLKENGFNKSVYKHLLD